MYDSVTPWTATCQASLSFTISQRLLKLMSIESVMPSNHLYLCRPLLLLPSIFPSIRVFSNESALCIRWQSIGTSASVLPMNIQGWFPLGLTVGSPCSPRDSQETSPTPQFKSINFSMLSLLSHPYMTTWKTIPWTRWTFVGKVMSLLFNMLSGFVIAFFPRSKRLLISWLQSPSAVILESKKIKCYCFHCFSVCLPWSDGTRCYDFQFLIVEF